MGYAQSLKKRFPGITLEPEDLFLLEAFQVKSLADRVLKPDAHAIHLLRSDVQAENPFHDILTSPAWNYDYLKSNVDGGLKIKYFKTVG